MSFVDLFYCFNLDDHLAIDDEIDAVLVDDDSAVAHGHADLAREWDAALLELDRKGLLVRRLEKAWAECSVYGYSRTNDSLSVLAMRYVVKPIRAAMTLDGRWCRRRFHDVICTPARPGQRVTAAVRRRHSAPRRIECPRGPGEWVPSVFTDFTVDF